jgi:hypothetical protein
MTSRWQLGKSIHKTIPLRDQFPFSVPPLGVKIISDDQPLAAGKEYPQDYPFKRSISMFQFLRWA